MQPSVEGKIGSVNSYQNYITTKVHKWILGKRKRRKCCRSKGEPIYVYSWQEMLSLQVKLLAENSTKICMI